jgi:hypothetical protein
MSSYLFYFISKKYLKYKNKGNLIAGKIFLNELSLKLIEFIFIVLPTFFLQFTMNCVLI